MKQSEFPFLGYLSITAVVGASVVVVVVVVVLVVVVVFVVGFFVDSTRAPPGIEPKTASSGAWHITVLFEGSNYNFIAGVHDFYRALYSYNYASL